MKLSSKGHYGLLALAELVDAYKSRRAMQVKEIARSQEIPTEYLGQIMVLLKRGRLVHGSRGPAGGYVLARPPEAITVREALHVLEGPAAGFDLRLAEIRKRRLVEHVLHRFDTTRPGLEQSLGYRRKWPWMRRKPQVESSRRSFEDMKRLPARNRFPRQ